MSAFIDGPLSKVAKREMNTTPERRQRAKAADEERTWLAVDRGHAALHAAASQLDPRSPLRLPDIRGKHIAVVGRPIENSQLGAAHIGAAMDAARAREADERSHQTLVTLAHATRVATLGGLAASIAHEINQPLAAIVINGDACMRWLACDIPDLVHGHVRSVRKLRTEPIG